MCHCEERFLRRSNLSVIEMSNIGIASLRSQREQIDSFRGLPGLLAYGCREARHAQKGSSFLRFLRLLRPCLVNAEFRGQERDSGGYSMEQGEPGRGNPPER
jgi:hypothetical protein